MFSRRLPPGAQAFVRQQRRENSTRPEKEFWRPRPGSTRNAAALVQAIFLIRPTGAGKMDSRLRGNDSQPTTKIGHCALQTESVNSRTPTRARSQRSGSIRGGGGNCLTEPGIVCFPVASHPERRHLFGSSGGKTVRGRRRSFGGPAPDRPGMRPHWCKPFS